MHCSNCNHHIEGKQSRCPQCNFPVNQNIVPEETKDSSMIHCHNCGTANETERSRCYSCNIELQSKQKNKKKARTYKLNSKADTLLTKDMFTPYTLNGIQISRS